MVKIDKPLESGASGQAGGVVDPTGEPTEVTRRATPGSARAAWQHRTFRMVYLGAFTSSIGTWMQNVVLGALAYNLTHSAVFVGIMAFAQLGPLLLFSTLGGMLADSFDRKKLLIILTAEQGIGSVALGYLAFADSPSKAALVGVVFLIGVGNALYAPVFSAILPVLVPRRDISGAISLNSVQMNASRVVGPAIGSVLYASIGAAWVFQLNALSYLAVIFVLLRGALPDPPDAGATGWRRLVGGITVARADRVVAQCLIVVATFSLLCLPFITQMPSIADRHFGIDPKSTSYGLLYGAFGVGAVVGALSIGTIFAQADKARLTRRAMVGFAALLTIFGALRVTWMAYVAVLLVGTCYFAVITSLSTVLQEKIDDADRGKVMAWWIMGFGGVVPIGGLVGGWLMDVTSIELVLGGGALVAVALAATFDLRTPPDQVDDQFGHHVPRRNEPNVPTGLPPATPTGEIPAVTV
ncbi:MAG TPA: MFS transporter [Acidimicrobiales bacterium]|nr:MFS transporter [Acidimicrobiales bacterium]